MIRYYRSNTISDENGRRPVCSLFAKQTMVAYSADFSQTGLMADVTDEQNQSIIDSGGALTTRQELSDIYNFPDSFPPTIPPIS
jgi:hypothetical protein